MFLAKIFGAILVPVESCIGVSVKQGLFFMMYTLLRGFEPVERVECREVVEERLRWFVFEEAGGPGELPF